MFPIADLHCDLLSYLAHDDKRSIFDKEVRCSYPQLELGNVFFQILAIYSQTETNSVDFAEKQFKIFRNLSLSYPDKFTSTLPQSQSLMVETPEALQNRVLQKIKVAAAIENASGLCDEKESLSACFIRFDKYRQEAGPIIYVSLTWNHENRFGGGNLSDVGLKKDGEQLLDYLSNKKIAIDLSHTSDALAYGILNYIDKKNLQLIPIASHSNFRKICPQLRNLSDIIAKEIIQRGGIIGLNFFKAFLGDEGINSLIHHINHARYLNALNHLCFGADFFYDRDIPTSSYPYPYYNESFENAESYPRILTCINKVCTKQELEKISHKNVNLFFERLYR